MIDHFSDLKEIEAKKQKTHPRYGVSDLVSSKQKKAKGKRRLRWHDQSTNQKEKENEKERPGPRRTTTNKGKVNKHVEVHVQPTKNEGNVKCVPDASWSTTKCVTKRRHTEKAKTSSWEMHVRNPQTIGSNRETKTFFFSFLFFSFLFCSESHRTSRWYTINESERFTLRRVNETT